MMTVLANPGEWAIRVQDNEVLLYVTKSPVSVTTVCDQIACKDTYMYGTKKLHLGWFGLWKRW